jgi:sugar lactone lactonase YvrE
MAASIVIGQPSFVTNTVPLTPTAASLNHPMGIALDYDNNLVVADSDNNRVLIFEGPLETGQAAAWVIGQPWNLVADPDGVYGNFTTNAAPDPPTATSLNHPTGVAIGAVANELYIADTANHRVLIYWDDPRDGKADSVIGQPGFTSNAPNNGGVSAAALNAPTGLAMDSGDRLYVADAGNHRVLEYDSPLTSQAADQVFGQGGSFTTTLPNLGGVSADSLNAPTGIATDENYWNVFIADRGNNRVLEYDEPLDTPPPKLPSSTRGRCGPAVQALTWKSGAPASFPTRASG